MYKNRDEIAAALEKEDVLTLAEVMDGNDYDYGALEAVERTSRNNSRVIARLLASLVKKGILSIDEAVSTIDV